MSKGIEGVSFEGEMDLNEMVTNVNEAMSENVQDNVSPEAQEIQEVKNEEEMVAPPKKERIMVIPNRSDRRRHARQIQHQNTKKRMKLQQRKGR